MSIVHVSMASGGSYAMMHAGFWEEIDREGFDNAGKLFRNSVTSISGSSAGAVVGAAVAMGVPGRTISRELQRDGMPGRWKYLRAMAAYLHLPFFKKSMYNGDLYLRRLNRLCDNHVYGAVPMHVAVTTSDMVQHSVRYGPRSNGLTNAATASASIPFILQPRHVDGYGMCVDGSVTKSSFPEGRVSELLLGASGTLVLLNCLPWPGHRHDSESGVGGGKRLALTRVVLQYGQDLYAHAMERALAFIIKPSLQYQDGIFDVSIDNTSGEAVVSEAGNLHVIFVAPTHAQYTACGGAGMIAHLDYDTSNKNILEMRKQGIIMARDFVDKYVTKEYGGIRI